MTEILNEIEANEVTERDNLAVVYRVERLEAIPNKDRIELVHLKDCGYTCICEKGHKVGDFVVFIKYDSIVPAIEMFDFMKEFKYRVKPKSFTERDENDEVVKKIYSQGIVIPVGKVIDYLEQGGEGALVFPCCISEGTDLTSIIGVKKYIPPVQNGGGSSFGQMKSKGDFPTHIVSKTDEPNLASKVRALDELQGKPYYITIKIEGSSLTFMNEEDDLNVCSRNNQIGEHETNKFWQGVLKYDLREKLKEPHNTDLVFQSELYGEGIQKNKLGIKGVDIAVFNISRKSTRVRLGYEDMIWVCGSLDVPMVEVIMEGDSFDMTFDDLQKLADSVKYPNGELAEGIVVRPKEPFYSKVLKDVFSVKVINREYKL